MPKRPFSVPWRRPEGSFREHADFLEKPGRYPRRGRRWDWAPTCWLLASTCAETLDSHGVSNMAAHGYLGGLPARRTGNPPPQHQHRSAGNRRGLPAWTRIVEVWAPNRHPQGHFDEEFYKVIDSLLSRYRCSTLGTKLSRQATQMSDEGVEKFWNFLCSPERCLPVVVIAENRRGIFPIDGDKLQHDLLGLAEVVSCSDKVAWNLGYYAWKLTCYDGQVRIFSPNLSRDDDDVRHRIWSFDK